MSWDGRRQAVAGDGGDARTQREAWLRALREKEARRGFGHAGGMDVRAKKGMGPNKACGHKGGISRQGSKRG